MRIRTVKTASGKHALQVVSKYQGKLKVHKHIGTYENDTQKQILHDKAIKYIEEENHQISLIEHLTSIKLKDIIVTENKPLFAYQLFSHCFEKIGFSSYPDEIIKDLVIARLYQPTSKLETQEILTDLFEKTYSIKTIYRHLKKSLDLGIKDHFQKALIDFSRNELKDNLKLIFYDVTTLFFESQIKSQLRDFGFSKDHRSSDTQIVIGLVVTKQGFPLYFDIFQGNTFEGNTFVGVVKNIQKLLGSEELIVIADSAMISRGNMKQLDTNGIGFIVGARIANLPQNLIDRISQELQSEDGKITTVSYQNYRLICQYLKSRAAQDRFNRNKQLDRARAVIESPHLATRSYRFVKRKVKDKYVINQTLFNKAEMLEGIKGFITNTLLLEQTIIDRYHDLWNIEKSFRITKSDLAARPIFHRLDKTIKAHMIIVFASLAIAKYIELSTNLSLHKVLKLCSKVLTNKLTNTKTGETMYTETTIENSLLKEKIEMLRSLGH